MVEVSVVGFVVLDGFGWRVIFEAVSWRSKWIQMEKRGIGYQFYRPF